MFWFDVLCRAAIYPSFLKDGVFDDELFILLRPNDKKNPTEHSFSVASLWICRNEDGVHRYGFATASAITRAKSMREGAEITFEEQKHYLGYYELYFGKVIEAPLEFHKVHCYWKPEYGQECHFQVDVRLVNENSTKSQNKADIRTFRAAVADSCWGPECCNFEINSSRLLELQGLLPIKSIKSVVDTLDN